MEEPTRMSVGAQVLVLLHARPEGLTERLLMEVVNFHTLESLKRPGLASRPWQRSRRGRLEHALASLLRRKLVDFMGDGRWRLRV